MAYVKVAYDKRRENKGRAHSAPSLGVSRNGHLTLNTKALAYLGNPAKILLLWDAEERRMGVQSADVDDKRAYSVNHPNGYSAAQVHPRAFWTHIGVTPKRLSLPAVFDDQTKTLSAVID